MAMDMKREKQLPRLDENSPLRDVLQHFDSKAALGKSLGLTRQAISNMDINSPLSRLHYLTLRHEQRPDLYQFEESAA